MKIITGCSPALSRLSFLLTGGVEHDQGCGMFLQEAVKGLISQVEDRGVCLRPRHLGGLRLGGLRAETGRGDGKGNGGEGHFKKRTHSSWQSNLYGAKIGHSCSPHSTQYVTHIHTHTHTSGPKQPRLDDRAQCCDAKNEWT